MDFFVETDLGGGASNFRKAVQERIPRGLLIDNTPPRRVPGGRFFIFLRITNTTEEEVEVRAVQFCHDNQIQIVGRSWKEVWSQYEHAAHVFDVRVVRPSQEGAVQRTVPLADLEPGEYPIGGIAYVPGVFMGDGAEEFPVEIEHVRSKTLTRIADLQRAIDEDNALTDIHKNKINKYLEAIKAIVEQVETDKGLLREIVGRLKTYLQKLGFRIGERIAVNQVLDWLEQLLDLLT